LHRIVLQNKFIDSLFHVCLVLVMKGVNPCKSPRAYVYTSMPSRSKWCFWTQSHGTEVFFQRGGMVDFF